MTLVTPIRSRLMILGQQAFRVNNWFIKVVYRGLVLRLEVSKGRSGNKDGTHESREFITEDSMKPKDHVGPAVIRQFNHE